MYLLSYSTVRNQQQSPLLRLPPELRNKIYVLAIESREIYVTSPGRRCTLVFSRRVPSPTGFSIPLYSVLSPRDFVALPQVCRQLHHETASLHFALNTWCGGDRDLLCFFARCKASKQFIQSLSISVIRRGRDVLDPEVMRFLQVLPQLPRLKSVIIRTSPATRQCFIEEVQRLCGDDVFVQCVFKAFERKNFA